jgi:hypothetical protein
MFELVLMGVAVLVAVGVMLVSRFARAICWDCLAHPTHTCVWAREGRTMRELTPGVDYVEEN